MGSSSITFVPGFGDSRRRSRWWRGPDDALETTIHDTTEGVEDVLNFTDWLESGESVSSAAYEDRGAVSSGKALSSPTVTHTFTGVGECKVTVTMSSGRKYVQIYRLHMVAGGPVRSDYNV